MGKIADAGAKMDKMVNGTKGGHGAGNKQSKKKQSRNKNTRVNITNNYYYNPPPKESKTKKKQKKKSGDFNTDYSEFYKIGLGQ